MKKSVLIRLLSYTRPYALLVVLAALLALLEVVLSLYIPILSGRAIDFIVGKDSVNFLGIAPVLLQFAAVALVSALLSWLGSLCNNAATSSMIRDIRTAAFDKLERLPIKSIDGELRGDVLSRISSDVELISDGLLQGFSQLSTGLFTVVATLIFMFSVNAAIATVVMLLTPLSLIVAWVIAKGVSKYVKARSVTRGRLFGYIEEMIGSQKTVNAFGRQARAMEDFGEINAQLNEVGFKAQFYQALVNPSTRFVNGLVYAAVGIFGALRVVAGVLTVGGLSSFLLYARQYTKPFNEISGVVAELQSAIAGAGRVFELLDREEERPENSSATPLIGCRGNVKAENVSFSYKEGRPILQDISFYAGSGQRIAIVGPTGSGKTTLINLLMRFFETDSGSIEVDGKNIKELTKNSLRQNFGMVLQDSWLFSGSIKDNISYGKENATSEQIVEAAKSARIHRFISNLPQGYDTVIEADDGGISEGQRQLLCIARVMLTQPPMLILDEATSFIDTATELRVQKAFAQMMEGRTSFVVAHRLSTIQTADMILVMKDGRIVERGRHEELLKAGGFYKYLYMSQFAQQG